VQAVENVYLYNIDHLEAIVRENVKSRERELDRCDEIVAERATALMPKLNPPPIRRPAFPDQHGVALFPIRSLQSLNPPVQINQYV
jgi:hypothetical protein